MNKETVKELLRDIERHSLLGMNRADVDMIQMVEFAVNKGLLDRTDHGNFVVTEKGAGFLKGYPSWENLLSEQSAVEVDLSGYESYLERQRIAARQQQRLKTGLIIVIAVLFLLFLYMFFGTRWLI